MSEPIDEHSIDQHCDFPDAVITVDRLDANGVMEDEIHCFRHSQSHPFATDLLIFAKNVARLTLFAETDYVTGLPEGADPASAQADLDWLTAQDETLESIICQARALTTPKPKDQLEAPKPPTPQPRARATPAATNPLAGDTYDSNDPQTGDLKHLVETLTQSLKTTSAALASLMEIAQDQDQRVSDGQALADALKLIAQIRGAQPHTDPKHPTAHETFLEATQNAAANEFLFRGATGIPFIAIYAENPAGNDAFEGSTVSFYDSRFSFTPQGQFIAAYYVSTLIESQDLKERGLCLQGGVPAWSIGAETMGRILRWLAAKPYRPFGRPQTSAPAPQSQTQAVPETACHKNEFPAQP